MTNAVIVLFKGSKPLKSQYIYNYLLWMKTNYQKKGRTTCIELPFFDIK